MASQHPRRFWKEVRVVEAAPGHYAVELDGRRLKTPGKHDLAVASQGLADAVEIGRASCRERVLRLV